MQNVEILGIASGWAAQVRDSEFGPEVLKSTGFFKDLIDTVWNDIVYPSESSATNAINVGIETKPVLGDFFRKVVRKSEEVMKNSNFPIFVGGDHGNAIATWTSVIKHHKAQENFGLMWIDAHMDAHTYETSPSKAFHGMPLAVLLGHGEEEFVNLGGFSSKLKPSDIVLIGIRSYEEEEKEFLESRGVRIMYMDEVKSRGFNACFNEAMGIVNKDGKKFGISLDLDFFDPEFAPGTPSLEPNGEDPKNVLPTLKQLANNDDFCALEIVEFNPKTDVDNKTLNLLQDIIVSTTNK